MKARELVRDVFGLAGAGLLVAGVWKFHPGAALIVAGLLLITAAVITRRA